MSFQFENVSCHSLCIPDITSSSTFENETHYVDLISLQVQRLRMRLTVYHQCLEQTKWLNVHSLNYDEWQIKYTVASSLDANATSTVGLWRCTSRPCRRHSDSVSSCAWMGYRFQGGAPFGRCCACAHTPHTGGSNPRLFPENEGRPRPAVALLSRRLAVTILCIHLALKTLLKGKTKFCVSCHKPIWIYYKYVRQWTGVDIQ